MKRVSALLLLTSILLAVPPVAAQAYNVGRMAYDSGSVNNAYGVSGLVAVFGQRPPDVDLHVSSLYVQNEWQSPYDFVEIGYVLEDAVPSGGTTPYAFVAWWKNGRYGDLDLYSLAYGSTHNCVAQHTAAGYWEFYFNGVKKYSFTATFSRGTAMASSERSSTLVDSNWAHFGQLRRKNGSGTSVVWSTLTTATPTYPDPDYKLRKVSNEECYVEHK